MNKHIRDLFFRILDHTVEAEERSRGERFPIYDPAKVIRMLDMPINKTPIPVEDLITEYKEVLLDGSLNKRKPEYMAFVDSGNVDTNILAAPFIELFSQNQIVVETDSPRSTFIEIKLIQWIRQLIGWVDVTKPFPANPLEASGTFCASGSTANLLGLLAARSAAYPNVRQEGMEAVDHRSFVLVPDTYHYSMRNAAWTCGLGLNSVVSVPTDREYRMDPIRLRQTISRILKDKNNKIIAVMAVAGNSYTMSIDPIGEISHICREFGIYLHVDACNGGALLFSDRLRPNLDDLKLADSVSFDPHKNLSVTYPSSLILFQHQQDLQNIVSEYGNIVNNPESFDLGTINPIEGSRGFHSFKLWLLIRYYGLDGIGERVERNHNNTLYFHRKLITDANFEPLHTPNLFNQAFIVLPHKRKGELIKASSISQLNSWLFEQVKGERKYFIHHYRIKLTHPSVIRDEDKSFVLCAMFGNPEIANENIDGLISHMNEILTKCPFEFAGSVTPIGNGLSLTLQPSNTTKRAMYA